MIFPLISNITSLHRGFIPSISNVFIGIMEKLLSGLSVVSDS
jgi:hypothetical protein